jgi:hypothetical protein
VAVLPAPGTFSLSVSHGAGSSVVGVGMMIGERTRADLGVGLSASRSSLDDGDDERSVREEMLAARLGLRRYLFSESGIAPFVGAAVNGSIGSSRTSTPDDGTDLRGLGAQLSAGAEWFPVARIGLSGETGISLNTVRYEDEAGGSGETLQQRSRFIGTFSSALEISIYF